jgi:hypothetical protein
MVLPCSPVFALVREMPSHGGNTGSNPVGDASDIRVLRAQREGFVQNLANIQGWRRLVECGLNWTGPRVPRLLTLNRVEQEPGSSSGS